MRIFLLFAHPGQTSFNHAILEQLRDSFRDHELLEHDLYHERFDPVLPHAEIQRRYSLEAQIQAHVRDLQRCDAVVAIHPDWWGQPPAILKGWLDRVLRQGIAYDYEGPEFGPKQAVPLLSRLTGLVFVTSDSEASHVQPLFDMIWRDRVFAFCGVRSLAVEVFAAMRTATRRVRLGYLERVRRRAQELIALQADD